MSGAADRFREAAGRAGLTPDVRRFPEGTRTAEDAARAIGCDVAQIVKSLVFMADGAPVLALTSGRNRVDLPVLAALSAASEARKATAEEVRSSTGYSIGGTPPLPSSSGMSTFIDETLLGFDELWAAAGTPDAVFSITPADLVRVTGGIVAAFAE